jgi:hypothetical protein
MPASAATCSKGSAGRWRAEPWADQRGRASISGMMTSVSLWALACGIAVYGAAIQGGPPAQAPPPEPTLKAGDRAPDFALQGSDGKMHRLSDYKGKTVVLAWFPAAFTAG